MSDKHLDVVYAFVIFTLCLVLVIQVASKLQLNDGLNRQKYLIIHGCVEYSRTTGEIIWMGTKQGVEE